MTDRGQSTLDFLLGTVVFLVAVMVVVAVVPGMLNPFVTGSEPDPVIADRAVTSLVTDEIAAPSTPYSTTEPQVSDVFNRTEENLSRDLGLPERTTLNATITNQSGTIGAVGPTPPDERSVTAAWRYVTYEGGPANVTVKVW